MKHILYLLRIIFLLGTRVRRMPSSAKSSAKKVKKRNPWSDDESKSESDLEENEPVIIPRDSLLRRAAGNSRFFGENYLVTFRLKYRDQMNKKK